MTFLKTLLGTIAVCAVLLAGAALTVGRSHSVTSAPAPRLTAAAVLATDGMGPDGRPDAAASAPRRSDGLAVAPAADAQPAG